MTPDEEFSPWTKEKERLDKLVSILSLTVLPLMKDNASKLNTLIKLQAITIGALLVLHVMVIVFTYGR
jgi:hypothetical protein|tara:strand:+ start:437 stop:640 length:204 start_codon:yes stop_codon:yes gene_type:complete